MSDRQTKQGVRDLNSVSYNGHRSPRKQCRHHFAIRLVVGTRWAVDRDSFESYEEPVYGHKCMWCPAIREEIA